MNIVFPFEVSVCFDNLRDIFAIGCLASDDVIFLLYLCVYVTLGDIITFFSQFLNQCKTKLTAKQEKGNKSIKNKKKFKIPVLASTCTAIERMMISLVAWKSNG